MPLPWQTLALFVLLLNLPLLQADVLSDLQFVEIPAGEFIMGTTNIDEAVNDMPKPYKNLVSDEKPASV